MRINRNNYEVYLIDYLDGKLTPNQVADVLLFLEKNIDIKEEFEGINEVDLAEEFPIAFDSDFLLKDKNERSNYLLINELEGTLTLNEKAELNQNLIREPELYNQKKLFSYTISKPNLAVVFPNKSSLQKGTLILAWYKPLLRIAAILILIGGVGFGLYKSTQTDKKIAEVNLPSTPIETGDLMPSTQNIVENKKESISTVKPKHQPKEIPENIVKNGTVTLEKIIPIEANIVMHNTVEKPILQPVYAMANKTTPVINNVVVYDDVKTLAIKRIKQNANKLLGETDPNKNITLVELINKATGADVKINKDTSTGRINRFEIAALGFAWVRK